MNRENEQYLQPPEFINKDENRATIESEKKSIWDKKLKEVAELKDGAGNKIDSGMIETITALNLTDIPTLQSCEGHIDRMMSPWIEIDTGNNRSMNEIERKEWLERREKLQNKIDDLLSEFYLNRKVETYAKLMREENTLAMTGDDDFDVSDPYGDRLFSQEEKERFIPKIIAAQNEMVEFTGFLKKKFFGN